MSAEPAAAVHRSVVLPVSRETAWEAVTDPEQLACWLADEVELEPREGGAARFRWDDGEDRVGVVDELSEQRRIAFRWQPADPREESGESLVELTLDDVDGGTRISVVEVRTDLLRGGGAELAPASAPTAWAGRVTALAANATGARCAA